MPTHGNGPGSARPLSGHGDPLHPAPLGEVVIDDGVLEDPVVPDGHCAHRP